MNILVPNLGSTSVKYQILEMPAEVALAKGRIERVRDYREAIARIQTDTVRIDAVAFEGRARRTGVPRNLPHRRQRDRRARTVSARRAGLQRNLPDRHPAFRESLPQTPLVAAFEHEFHRTMPDFARQYGVPPAWREAGVARYGFHGASHQYVSERACPMLAGCCAS